MSHLKEIETGEMGAILPEIDMRAAFIAALERDPNDELTRAMFADWLAERSGQSSEWAWLTEDFVRGVRQNTKPGERRVIVVYDPFGRYGVAAAKELNVAPHWRACMRYVITIKTFRVTWTGPLRWGFESVIHAEPQTEPVAIGFRESLLARADACAESEGILHVSFTAKFLHDQVCE